MATIPPCVSWRVSALVAMAWLLVFSAVADESAPGVCTASLRPTEVGPPLSMTAKLEGREMVFEREPEFGARKVARGAFGDPPERLLGFALVRATGTLYLDLNRNRDLTDDPEGVLRVEAPTKDWASVIFMDAHFTLSQKGIPVPYIADLTFTRPRGRDSVCIASVKSGWAGTLVAEGEEYHVQVIDNLDGVLDQGDTFVMTRRGEPAPAEAREPADAFAQLRSRGQTSRLGSRQNAGRPAVSPASAPGVVVDYEPSVPYRGVVPKRLKIGSHHYAPEFAFTETESGTELAMTLRSSSLVYGDLRIAGESITSVKMIGPVAVTLVKPGEMVRVPVGDYTVREVVIDDGSQAETNMKVTVAVGETATLTAGGPLQPRIGVSRAGLVLRIVPQGTCGVGGEVYSSGGIEQGYSDGFAVYRGGEEVASGKFRYG